MTDQCDVNVLVLLLHGDSDNRKYEFLDRLSGAILQVVKALSSGEFDLSSVRVREHAFRPVLLIRKPTLTLSGPLISFRDAKVLFPEKRRGEQLRAGRIWLGCVDGPSSVVCAEEGRSDDVGEGRCGE